MKTAVIYARYSCEKQTEQSIEGQLRVCEEFAKAHDILILDTYVDQAMSGTNDNRPDFQRMIKDSKKHEWNYVLVYKLDRFSRNKYESVMHKRTLKDNGVTVLSAMENIPDTPEGIILESLLEGMNQYYSAELAQKVKRGMKETRIKGYFQGGYLIYGYKLDGRKIIINESEAPIVKYIFEQYNSGVYVRDIINSLHTKGITNRGKPFAKNTVYKMLQNEKYTGTYQHENEIIDNTYPQIISQELFAQVKAKTDKNKYGKRSVQTVYLLRHKLRCGYCGKSISAECGRTKNGKQHYYYKCIGIKKYQNGCKKTTIPKETLEQFVLEQVINEFRKPDTMSVLVEYLMQLQSNLDSNNVTMKLLLREQKQSQIALDNVMKAVEQGIINKTTNQRMKELETQLEELERQILIEKAKSSIKIPRDKIEEYYISALRQEPLQLINIFIKEIILYNDEIHITFNSPLKSSPDDNQGYFYCTDKALGNIKTLIKYYV